MVKKCLECDTSIAEQYTYCMACNAKQKSDPMKQISQSLEHINWNLGRLVAVVEKNPQLLQTLYDNPPGGSRREPRNSPSNNDSLSVLKESEK